MAKKILFIDDDPDFVKAITLRLTNAGYEVISAADGIEGLEKAEKLSPDLVVLDLMLPKIGGYAVCRLLKFNEKNKSVPVIIVSAKSQDIDKEMAKKVEADDYIVKPFEWQGLLGKIKILLGE